MGIVDEERKKTSERWAIEGAGREGAQEDLTWERMRDTPWSMKERR